MAKIPFDINVMLDHPEWRVEDENGVEITLISDLIRHRNGSGSDLFIITPEPELTEFEKELATVIGFAISQNVVGPNEDTFRFVKNWSERLLDLARKEIMDGWSKGLRDTQDISGKAYNDGYQLGLEQGKAEALKDLPRWKRAERDMRVVSRCVIERDGDIDLSNFIPKNSYYIPVKDLLELAGFKED